MIYQRLRVFVSSGMQELAPERAAIKAALSELHIDSWIFEKDAGARPQGIQHTYKQEIDGADLYIGVFWRDYGDYTIDEFNYATEQNKECLIYEKRVDLDGKRDPRLQDFLDQIGKVETGLTICWFDTLEKLSEGVKQDLARWQAEKVRSLRESNVRYRPSPVEAGEHRELRVLLSKVKHFWIEGVLDRAIQRADLLELGKDTQPGAVANPWEAVLELPYEGSRPVASGKGIADVFDELEHSVLILGQPGSGKTTTLLMLVRELMTRAESDSALTVPVVFHLSSWVDSHQPLKTWLVGELNDKYQIPKRIGETWLQNQRLLLLLDGLDEVTAENRIACVEAINQFARETGLPGMAVCCRLEQYEELPVKLALNGAICLRPLTDAQIDKYVQEAGAELNGLRSAFRQDSVLLELARSPLMLNLMCLAYQGYAPEHLAGRESAEDRSEHLFATYIDHMFRSRGKAALIYPRERTLGWLSWTAGRLLARNQTMFLIEGMQPGWLSSAAQRWAYLAGISLVLGIVTGLINIAYWWNSLVPSTPEFKSGLQAGEAVLWLTAMPLWFLALGWVESMGSASGRPFLERAPAGIRRAGVKAFVGASLWSPIALVAIFLWEGRAEEEVLRHLLWAGVPIVLYMSAIGRNRSISYSIETVESLRPSLKNALRGALVGLIGGAVVGGVVYAIPIFAPAYDLQGKNWILTVGFTTVGVVFGAILGALKPYVVESKTRPNQGIRLSLRMAVLMGLQAVWPVLIAMVFGVLGFQERFPDMESAIIGAFGFFNYLFAAIFLWYGGLDVLKHYVLRTVLAVSGQLPWKVSRLLDQARGLNLMQRVGNAYIFVHRRLLEHLAASGQLK